MLYVLVQEIMWGSGSVGERDSLLIPRQLVGDAELAMLGAMHGQLGEDISRQQWETYETFRARVEAGGSALKTDNPPPGAALCQVCQIFHA